MVAIGHRFRVAALEDVSSVMDMMAILHAEDGYAFSEPEARALLERFLAEPGLGRLWVAEVDLVVVGYLVVTLGFSFEFGGRDAFVDELFVREGFRGHGLGREAMALAEAYCRDSGVGALHLEVERHRERAAALYRRLGYREHGRPLLTKRLGAQR